MIFQNTSNNIRSSLISFENTTGVGVMGKMIGIYTFSSHIKFAWTILIGHIASVTIW